MFDIGGVYLVAFPNKGGREFYGKHYAVALTVPSADDGTLLVAPITGKKPKTRYKGGLTLDNYKYQSAPSYDKSFIYTRKIQEIDKRKVVFVKKKQVDETGRACLDNKGQELFIKQYKKIYQLDSSDYQRLQDSLRTVLHLAD